MFCSAGGYFQGGNGTSNVSATIIEVCPHEGNLISADSMMRRNLRLISNFCYRLPGTRCQILCGLCVFLKFTVIFADFKPCSVHAFWEVLLACGADLDSAAFYGALALDNVEKTSTQGHIKLMSLPVPVATGWNWLGASTECRRFSLLLSAVHGLALRCDTKLVKRARHTGIRLPVRGSCSSTLSVDCTEEEFRTIEASLHQVLYSKWYDQRRRYAGEARHPGIAQYCAMTKSELEESADGESSDEVDVPRESSRQEIEGAFILF